MTWEDILKGMTNRSPQQQAGQLRIAIARKRKEIAVMEKQLASLPSSTPYQSKKVGATTYQPTSSRKEMEALLDKKLQGLITEEEFQAEKKRLGE
jgi:hypothetical protein